MKNKKDICKKNTNNNSSLKEDFRINVSTDFFRDLELIHLHSAVYEEPKNAHFIGGIITVINGYTEWVSKVLPIISVGWDWELRYKNDNFHYIKTGPAFSNIAFLLNENEGCEVNEDTYTQKLIDSKINQIDWENKIVQCITQ